MNSILDKISFIQEQCSKEHLEQEKQYNSFYSLQKDVIKLLKEIQKVRKK